MKRNVSYKDIRFYKFIKIIIAHKKKIERKKEKDRLFISNQYNSHVMILLKKISKWQKLKKDKSSAKFNLSMGHFFLLAYHFKSFFSNSTRTFWFTFYGVKLKFTFYIFPTINLIKISVWLMP